MSTKLARALQASVAKSPLVEPLALAAPALLEQRGSDPAAGRLEPRAICGLARAIASQPAAGRYLARRPALLERLAAVPGPLAAPGAPWDEASAALRTRASELRALPPPAADVGLERILDDLRLLRRDETVFAACLDLGGAPFPQVSDFLTTVAETCARIALHAAEHHPSRMQSGLAVVGMGKIAGRELTYHSDLDLVFLYPDSAADEVGELATRTAQRLISYLSTMTAAGVAYAVDARLRPSGRQGALVSSFASFRAYQTEKAATWEHLALMRARAIAGDVVAGEEILTGVRDAVLTPRRQAWRDISAMRTLVERQRGQLRALAYKTGRGGLMDLEFLAAGALLECGPCRSLPSVAEMLRAHVSGPRVDRLLEHHAFLRRVEARARWVADRAVESVDPRRASAAWVAELVRPGLRVEDLVAETCRVCDEIRDAFLAVVEADSIQALVAA